MPKIIKSNVKEHRFNAVKDFVNEHRREIVRTMTRTSSSTEIDPFSQISHAEETESSGTQDYESDDRTFTTLNDLCHKRVDRRFPYILYKKTSKMVDSRFILSKFAKDVLVQLQMSFRKYNPEDPPEIDYRTTDNITASPQRERSPPIIRISLESRVQKRAIQQDANSSPTNLPINPSTPFQNLSEAEPSSSHYPSALLDSFSGPNSYQDAHYDFH